MTTKQTTKDRSGFAFTTALAAGMAVSVMATSLLANATGTFDEVAVRVAAQQFAGTYRRARAVAVNSGRTAEVRIDGNRIWIEVDTTLAGTGERTKVGRAVNLDYIGVKLETTTTSLCFDSSGLANVRGSCSAAGGEIEFSKGNSVKRLATTLTGVIPR